MIDTDRPSTMFVRGDADLQAAITSEKLDLSSRFVVIHPRDQLINDTATTCIALFGLRK